MAEGGSCRFTTAERYENALKGCLNFVAPRLNEFHARLTWIDLPSLHLLRSQEGAPRVARVSLPRESVFVIFPTRRGAPLICDGTAVSHGQFMLHAVGDRLYQRTIAATGWGCISLGSAELAELTRVIHGQALRPPRQAQILSVPPPHGMELLRLHAQAGRIIEQNPDRIAHSEVARALEQDLSLAVAKCLGGDRLQPDSVTRGARASMLAQLEAMIVEHPHRLPGICEICERVGVSEPTLQAVCDTVLGMPIQQYQRLRRLKLVRADLAHSTEPSSAADLARRYGFTNANDFVVEYVRAFGEFPLAEGQPATDHA